VQFSLRPHCKKKVRSDFCPSPSSSTCLELQALRCCKALLCPCPAARPCSVLMLLQGPALSLCCCKALLCPYAAMPSVLMLLPGPALSLPRCHLTILGIMKDSAAGSPANMAATTCTPAPPNMHKCTHTHMHSRLFALYA